MKVLEWSQHYTAIFRRSRAANSLAGDWVWPKIKLIQTFIGVLVTCKNEEDPFKNEGARVTTKITRCKYMQLFYDAQGKLTPQSEVCSTVNSNSCKLL